MNNKTSGKHPEKETYGSFETGEKERFAERLEQLLRGRSKYQAAKDWGINQSTFKNYFSRQGSLPRFEVLEKISKHEHVSIEWLVGRETDILDSDYAASSTILEPASEYDTRAPSHTMNERVVNYDTGLFSIFSILSEEEKKSLFELIARKGVDTVLQLQDERNLKLIQCPDYEKDRLLILLEAGGKKETSALGEDVASPGPFSESKKAG
ncbi:MULTISPECIES: helix-turn-helix domain-containing protein [unclassified Klebsiella]|uniref:helix-turn-helix domain-containing protein n=1 Tax=Enterobacteriaceae TaxID=543 RepID=UPI0015DCFE27|nr:MULTISPECIES: helix-turn-helix transcriptional regulator [unclassified Klebsiella]HAT3952096.1 helix-turn-helix transcriptional regulator [Kluyvera ascorbata]BBR57886.1 hypothetical protein WP4W18E05_12540 [Klebsiella sp. WP4-W18-ESBL-05]BBS92863.1 hypothetical protein WP7S18C02_34780 [Klebsiella sp. WP7-S18-CRE-02]BBS97892.1 hypothetical protein WP7S18C03_34850 [Klebsiella sp. WP7-S18-CRE-03]BBT02959.1 hypothetical protein WP7S18E04_35210 [Klebsiella sp. WP7-S18-ESBL-04]